MKLFKRLTLGFLFLGFLLVIVGAVIYDKRIVQIGAILAASSIVTHVLELIWNEDF